MIYQRQKILLALLEAAPNKAASKIQFVKWLFLLKEEEKIDRYANFYSFFPYKYGPFSFVVYRDIAELERFGWVESDSISFRRVVPEKSAGFRLPPSVTSSIERIVENYGELTQQSLMSYVYEKYPWYASRSRAGKPDSLVNSAKAQLAIHSLGYEGLSIDGFLNVILRAGIQVVMDSRSNPMSRKYGFSKPALADKCSYVGVEYYHFSEVGISSKLRRQIQDRQTLWDFYTREILAKNSEVLESIASICKNAPSVLVCFEKKPEDCHRHIMARELSIRTELPIYHYMEGRWKKDGRAHKVLITVKTYPTPSSKYDELVCTAGVREDGSFIRLYPIDYRYRSYCEWFQKYQWIEVEVERRTQDPRPESFRPIGEIKPLGLPINTSDNWARRKHYVFAKSASTMCDLQEKGQREVSLGIIKPSVVEDFTIEEAEREFPEEYLTKMQQMDIFQPNKRKPLEKIPYKFSYKYRCEDPECKGHKQMITDWEIGVLYLRMRDQYQDEEIACNKVREKFYDTICAADRDTYFFVGTTLEHGTWIVIGTFWPKKTNNNQLTFSDILAP